MNLKYFISFYTTWKEINRKKKVEKGRFTERERIEKGRESKRKNERKDRKERKDYLSFTFRVRLIS